MVPPKQPCHLYFSPRLQAKLRGALDDRSLLIEAPSGYGKTTVVQSLLRELVPRDAVWIRHVCVEETPGAAWRRLSRSVGKVNPATGGALANLGVPDEDTQGDAAVLLRGLECSSPTWLVLDDFHLIAPVAPVSVWKALLDHECPRLTVVLSSWPLAESVMPYEKFGFRRLDASDFSLTKADMTAYFAAVGVFLPEETATELYRRTEGWMIAVSLHLRRWCEGGDLTEASGIAGLLQDVVWKNLDEAGRDALLRLSPFDSFSGRQVSALSGGLGLPARLHSVLKRNALLRFDAVSGRYFPHGTLLEFVRDIFAQLPEERREDILLAAAAWCAENGEREKAVAFYHRLGDYERILSMDLSRMEDNRILNGIPEISYAEALRDVVAHSTQDMRSRHPLAMIQLAFELFCQGCVEDFHSLCADMAILIEEIPLTEPERNRLRGELLLRQAFSHYNDSAVMGAHMRAAQALIGGGSSLAYRKNAWTFGSPSVLQLYHRESGRLDAELADMEACLPCYVELSDGHGLGAPELMRAEALFERGEVEYAAILAHEARQKAMQAQQASLMMGADLLLGRVAILRGDASEFSGALNRVNRLAEDFPQKTHRLEADMVRAALMGCLGRGEGVAAWIADGFPGAFERRLFAPAVPVAQACRARLLLNTGKLEILLGEMAAMVGRAQAMHYAQVTILVHTLAAAAWTRLGEYARARAALQAALVLAGPDRLIMPFVEIFAFIAPVLNDLGETAAYGLSSEIRRVAHRWEVGCAAVARALFVAEAPFGLSAQEYRAAKLAADGLSNQEIASVLSLSLNTVKTHLKAVYRKSGANSRPTLRKLLKTL